MFAIGCLFPVIFGIGGVVLGAVLDGQQGSIWGGVAGLVVGFVIPAAMVYAFAKARQRRK